MRAIYLQVYNIFNSSHSYSAHIEPPPSHPHTFEAIDDVDCVNVKDFSRIRVFYVGKYFKKGTPLLSKHLSNSLQNYEWSLPSRK